MKIALQSLKNSKSILMTTFKHFFQRKKELYILLEQLDFVQTLRLATFAALSGEYHFMGTVNHRANSGVTHSTEQSLFSFHLATPFS